MSKKVKMELSEVESRLTQIIIEQMRLDGLKFNSSSSLAEAGLDSLAMVRILVVVEQEFGVWLEGGMLTPDTLQNSKTMAQCLYELMD